MPGCARLHDIGTGHDCHVPRPNDQASLDTNVNNRGVHRRTDHWMVHCCIPCHDGHLASGSPDVFVNNLDCGRCGDPVDCGSFVATCSQDVIIN